MDRDQTDLANGCERVFSPEKKYFYTLPLLWAHLRCVFSFLCWLAAIYGFFYLLAFIAWQRELWAGLEVVQNFLQKHFELSLPFNSNWLNFFHVDKGYIRILVMGLAILYAFKAVNNTFCLATRLKKNQYILYKGGIITRQGGVFSDFESILQIKNTIYVALVCPLFQRLFRIGHIYIQSSSSEVEAKIENIEQPERFYRNMLEFMQKKGFSLDRENIQKTSILRECLLVSAVIFGLTLIAGLMFYDRYAIWFVYTIVVASIALDLFACIIRWRSIDTLPILSTTIRPTSSQQINDEISESQQAEIDSAPLKIVRKPSALHSLPAFLLAALRLGVLVFIVWAALHFTFIHWPDFMNKVVRPWIIEHRFFLEIAAAFLVFLTLIPFLGRLLASRLFTYTIEKDRLTKTPVSLYKSDKFVSLKDVNYLCLQRHFWDMIFCTATIALKTIDGQSEMLLHDVPRFREFYQVIKNRMCGQECEIRS